MQKSDGTTDLSRSPSAPPQLLYAEREIQDPSRWQVPEHRHRHHEILVLMEGAQRSRVNGVERTARSGQVLVYGAGTPHEEWLLPDRQVEKYTLGFSWEGDLSEVPALVGDAAGRLTELASWITAETPQKGDLSPPRSEPLLYAFIGELFRAATRSGQELKSRAQQVFRARMRSLTSVEDLAHALDMSRSHFSRRFADEAEMSPSDFLRQERLLRARHLLRNTKMALKEIAAVVGVSSEQQLCRLIRRSYGVTPGQLRGASS